MAGVSCTITHLQNNIWVLGNRNFSQFENATVGSYCARKEGDFELNPSLKAQRLIVTEGSALQRAEWVNYFQSSSGAVL